MTLTSHLSLGGGRSKSQSQIADHRLHGSFIASQVLSDRDPQIITKLPLRLEEFIQCSREDKRKGSGTRLTGLES